MACGVPEVEAGHLMSHDAKSSHCYFVRQPETSKETDAAIRAVWSSCCGAVRYRGKDRGVLARFAELGELSKCDETMISAPAPSLRCRAIFRYRKPSGSPKNDLRAIFEFLGFDERSSFLYKASDFVSGRGQGSRIHRWGAGDKWFSITIRLRQMEADIWLLCIEDNEVATTGTESGLTPLCREARLLTRSPGFQKARSHLLIAERNIRTRQKRH